MSGWDPRRRVENAPGTNLNEFAYRRQIEEATRDDPHELLRRAFETVASERVFPYPESERTKPGEGDEQMASLDWSQCPIVESVPGRRSGAWVFRDTRMPVATVFENLEAGASIDEIVEQFHVTPEQVKAVLEFAARSLDPPPASVPVATSTDAHSL